MVSFNTIILIKNASVQCPLTCFYVIFKSTFSRKQFSGSTKNTLALVK